jgi:hypothetical protein
VAVAAFGGAIQNPDGRILAGIVFVALVTAGLKHFVVAGIRHVYFDGRCGMRSETQGPLKNPPGGFGSRQNPKFLPSSNDVILAHLVAAIRVGNDRGAVAVRPLVNITVQIDDDEDAGANLAGDRKKDKWITAKEEL